MLFFDGEVLVVNGVVIVCVLVKMYGVLVNDGVIDGI